MADIDIRALQHEDRGFVTSVVVEHFGSHKVVSRGRLHDCTMLPGFVAAIDTERVGLVLYDVFDEALEVVTLVSQRAGAGIGRQLLDSILAVARQTACRRAWLITTNNNEQAIRFYKGLGWRLIAVHEGAVVEARRIKPEIPLHDSAGVSISDEWEFEQRLLD